MSKAELIEQDRQALQPVVTDSSAIMAVIERAAQDPDTNVEKMERLFALYERMEAKRAEAEFNAAMTKAQTETRQIATNAENKQTKSRYATYGALDKALRPVYTSNGFSLSFDTADSPNPEHIRVLCYVSHEAGHSRTYKADMPADGKGAKGGDVMTKTHAAGAAMSYGSRYLLKMIFNVAIGEDDNDGNQPIERVSQEQVANLEALITEVGADKSAFLKYMQADSLDRIQAKSYGMAVKALEKKRGGK